MWDCLEIPSWSWWVAWAERILASFALPGIRVSNPCDASDANHIGGVPTSKVFASFQSVLQKGQEGQRRR